MPELPLYPDELLPVTRRVGRALFAFSGRCGGVSPAPYASLNLGLHVGDAEAAVQENRRRVLAALGAGERSLVEAEQVHGAVVAVVDGSWLRRHPGPRRIASGADALVTCEAGVVVSLYFADCVPVFLATEDGECLGLAHAGWRGTAARVVEATVAAMAGLCHVGPQAISAVIGPCVGGCCYEVGEEVVAALGEAPGAVRAGSKPGKWYVDLAEENARQLEAAGLRTEAIERLGRCTCCERDTFFSVRGDGPVTGRCGAFAYLTGVG